MIDPISIALSLAAKYALPKIGEALFGSKGEEVARQVGALAMEVTGKGTMAEAADAITADPALALEFAQKGREVDLEMARLHQKDRASARDMQKVTRSWIPAILAVMLTIAVVTEIGLLFFVAVPIPNRELLIKSLSLLEGVFITMATFYYGSAHKD